MLTVLLNEQVCRAPNVEIRDGHANHSCSLILAAKWGFDHYPEAPYLAGLINQFPRDSNATDFHMDVMDAPGTYDLVTSYFCFDYLDLNRVLPKVRSLLNPGGVFAGMFEYWWWPINSTGIIGHFPYAGARLSFKDLERYHAEHHPDLIENLYFKYHYFHEGKQRPTVDEWFSIAKSHGLKPIAFERIVPKKHRRIKDCPPRIFAAPWFDHEEVLRDIHELNPRVTTDDLFTSALRIAFIAI